MVPQTLIKNHSQTDQEVSKYHPIFSANEVGKITLTKEKLQSLFQYDFSQLPSENASIPLIHSIFRVHPDLSFLPIVNTKGNIIGYFTRKSFLSLLSENNYHRELLFRKDVNISPYINRNIVCIDAYTPLSEAAEILMRRNEEIRFDPFVVTLRKKFFGISFVDKILEGINLFMKRDIKSIEESQMALLNFFHEDYTENPLNFISYIRLLQGAGGDFVQKYEINRIFSLVALFDVSGKGIRASAMVFVLATLLNQLVRKLKKSHNDHIQEQLYIFNRELYYSTSSDLYASGLILWIDKQEKVISIFDFGHGLLWVKRNQKVYQLKTSKNKNVHFLGIFPNLSVSPIRYRLKKDDIIFSCSDGITEQLNPQREMYIKRIPFIIKKFNRNMNHNQKVLWNDWNQFRSSQRIRDDISFFIFQI